LTFDNAILAKVREVVENGEIYIYLYSQLSRNETYIHSYVTNKISFPEQAANIISSIQIFREGVFKIFQRRSMEVDHGQNA